jgi:hypothetical protein
MDRLAPRLVIPFVIFHHRHTCGKCIHVAGNPRVTDTVDADIENIVLASIRRHSMGMDRWRQTTVGSMQQQLQGIVQLEDEERPLVSYFASNASWYVITKRRVLGAACEQTYIIPAHHIIESRFGNFKGHGDIASEIMLLILDDGRRVELEYETGNASMAVIYGIDVLRRKLASVRRRMQGAATNV